MSRDELITEILTAISPNNGPGIQYVVVDKSEVIYSHSAGHADVENEAFLTPNHSMTKTLTAIAILQLAERDKLDLEERVSRFKKHPYNPDITIRQLLSHTSGIPNPIPLKWVHLAEDHHSFNERDALAAVLADNSKPDNPPGEKYSYSNINYWLLGSVIETVSSQDYAAYIRKNIFQLLGLTPDKIGFTFIESAPRAKGYLAKYSFMNLLKCFITDKAVWGHYKGDWLHIKAVYVNGPAFGGAIGTARAFSVLLQDLLAEKSVLLNKGSRKPLFSLQKTRSGQEINMTLGWHIRNLDGIRYYYKEGGGAGCY